MNAGEAISHLADRFQSRRQCVAPQLRRSRCIENRAPQSTCSTDKRCKN
jgi:hypothetical protein